MISRFIRRSCAFAALLVLPSFAPRLEAQAVGSLITNAGVARASSAVDSVFVDRQKRSDSVDVGDFTAYLLARLGVTRLDDSLAFRVSSDSSRIRIRGRLMDFPPQARAELGPIFSFLDSTSVFVAELSMPQAQYGIMRFRLERVIVGRTSIPDFLLAPALSEYSRRYPVLSAGGREFLVGMPPDARTRLIPNGIELWMPPAAKKP
ncbi:MAG: hypothetical protein ABJC19_06040 [Gemmatimonadota bacterium]